MEIIAHRGASYDAPENTLTAFRIGFEQADAVELDLHLSKDGQAVCVHDDVVNGHPVKEQTLEELKTLDVGSYKGSRYKEERIPTLSEALALLPDNKRYYLEIKCGPEILPAIKAAITESRKTQLVIIGFDFETMKEAKRQLGLPVYWAATKDTAPKLNVLMRYCEDAGLDGLDLDCELPIDTAFVTKMHEASLKVVTWTVNDRKTVERLAKAGVDGITTDYPLTVGFLAAGKDNTVSQG